jgi:hypothetical protein
LSPFLFLLPPADEEGGGIIEKDEGCNFDYVINAKAAHEALQ